MLSVPYAQNAVPGSWLAFSHASGLSLNIPSSEGFFLATPKP